MKAKIQFYLEENDANHLKCLYRDALIRDRIEDTDETMERFHLQLEGMARRAFEYGREVEKICGDSIK